MHEPEICDVDEGIIERSEDAGNAKDEFTWVAMLALPSVAFGDGKAVPSRTWGPREMFSVAARSTFFLGGMVVDCADGLNSAKKLKIIFGFGGGQIDRQNLACALSETASAKAQGS